MKMMESAREAVANGYAGQEEIEMATNGVEVNADGEVVPAHSADSVPLVNGNGVPPPRTGKRKLSGDGEGASPRNRMDIGLHNQQDFEYTGS